MQGSTGYDFLAAAGQVLTDAEGSRELLSFYEEQVLQLPPTGPIVGLEVESTFEVGSVDVPVGATLLLATDGLTEARDETGAFLGDEGVAASELPTGSIAAEAGFAG